MESVQVSPIVLLAVGGIFTVLWYLLRQKDVAQAEQIALLFAKHDEDAKALQDLRIQIAEGHYKKGELDAKFERLDVTIQKGFESLGMRFEKLSEVLIEHVSEHHKSGGAL